MKICYFLLSTQKNVERQDMLRDTWLREKKYFFLSDFEDKERFSLLMSTDSDYRSAEEKFINGINFAKNNADLVESYVWFFFCDDDTFVIERNLTDRLENLPMEAFSGKVLSIDSDPKNPIWNDALFPYPSGGAGFIVGAKFLSSCENFKNYSTGWSDVSLGRNLHVMNIRLLNVEGFNSNNPETLQMNADTASRQITFHYVKSRNQFNYLLDLSTRS